MIKFKKSLRQMKKLFWHHWNPPVSTQARDKRRGSDSGGVRLIPASLSSYTAKKSV